MASSLILSTLALSTLSFSTLALATPANASTNSNLTFSTPPYSIACNASLSQFQINIPEDDVQNLKSYLELFRAPPLTYENSDVGWDYGVPRDWLVNATCYWLDEYDWRKQEAILNSVPQFKLGLNDSDGESYSIHFAALFSPNKSAIPIILSHGFPDSYMIYMPILQKVQQLYAVTPDDLPYHLIVPSLIGTGFSSHPPLTKQFFTTDNARIFNELMKALGFGTTGYIAQGNDVGSMISEYMLTEFNECKAAHVTLWWGHPAYDPTTDLPATDLEMYALQRMTEINHWGEANVLLHADRSSTAGLTIGSNPISMLTWIGERMVLWGDPNAPLSLDVILTDVSIYWFTRTYPTSYWVYAAFRTAVNGSEINSIPDGPTLSGKPLGYSWFPNEVGEPPKSYFDKYTSIFNYFYQHDQGSHWSATDQPDVLWADIEDFVGNAWKA
ncbi:alpha/beta-hydrolase [Thozetella sp. PMI_491]|nr:alpha/beta-hydrolase [Thozetella sp. PMI_491]